MDADTLSVVSILKADCEGETADDAATHASH